MLIRWEDRDWALDIADLTNRQAMAIETEMGLSLADFYEKFEGDDEGGVAAFDAAKPYFLKIMTVVYWLMLDQNDVKVKIADTEFPVLRFAQAFAAGMAAAEAAQPAAANGEVKPDPTRPRAGSAPSRAQSSRSKKSRAVTAGSPDG